MFEIIEQVGAPLPEEEGLDLGHRDDLRYFEAALLLMERLTGVEATPDDLRESSRRSAVGFHQ